MQQIVRRHPGGRICRRRLLAVLATAGGGIASAGTMAQTSASGSHQLAETAASRLRAIQQDDGSAGAPAGPPQLPQLLNGYRERPPWKVAGVDYRVGIPAPKALTDWKALGVPGVTMNDASIRINAGSFVLDGVDFSTHGGAQIAVDSGATGTIRNCKFGGTGLKTVGTGIIDSSSQDLTVRNCVFDGAGAGTAACILFIRGAGRIALLYNHFDNFPSRIIELLKGSRVDYRFNLIGEGAMQAGAHMNYLEFESGLSMPTVAFNTTAQTARAPSGGEGFQFYCNAGGRMTDPVCVNNTMIARGGRGETVMSYLLHGSVYMNNIDTELEGAATIGGNYFDLSSAYGAFYGASFPGWHFGTNIDMVSGRAVPPPR